MQILGGPYRAGPWPGLTLRGALLIVLHAGLLAILAETWWPLSVLPLLTITVLMRMPGAASAVSGAYLLPRSLLTLTGALGMAPLLLAPAMAFDLVVWLRADDIPRRRSRWRKRDRRPRTVRAWRLALATVVFEVLLYLAG
jgi:hypothetical protein